MQARFSFLIVFALAAAAATTNAAPLPTHAEIRCRFDALDTTHNGAFGPNEWRNASHALFDATDKNHDGVIERAELGPNALIREAFPSIAEGHDDKLTRAEFLELRETIFHAAAIARNDYITFTEHELLVLLRRTGWTDRNRDGRIQMSELRGVLGRAFSVIDANRDDVLTGDETAFLSLASREAMDPKKSGRVTPEQLINGNRFLLGADQVNRNLVPRATPLSR